MSENTDSGFVLADSVARGTFQDDVYAHLGALAAVEFSRPDSPAQSGIFRFDALKYQALEQAAFEEAPRIEAGPPEAVTWSEIDERVTAFEKRLAASVLTSAKRGVDLSPFIQFSTKCYENWLTYDGMYPRTNGGNPWSRALHVLRLGRLLVIDNQTNLERIRKPGSNPESEAANLGVLVKAASERPAMMPVDDRFSLQARVLSILKQNARGHTNRLSLRVIADTLESMGTKMTAAAIQIGVTTPLKKAGVVGSNSKGFFFIDSEADLIESYCFHRTKVKSVDKIMRRYEARARDMNGDLSLENECLGSGKVLNKQFP